ncbi:SAICAR synthase-like protein, partial [Meredithblackwellia eburnea MCA 4105]
VTAWGVSEKEAFLQFAPELLGYLMAPERPSLLAKIFGFYTIKTKNLKTGEVRKLDLIVMEHLFHSQTITRQFDLKGIASRVAKPKSTASSKDNASKETLWDADWLSGSLQSRLLIYSHSKTLLRDALLNDSQFLAKCGNIDYSLLVGVNDTTHELVVGLIDIISVFNLAKMLENAGKTALKKATASEPESVTVIPPSDYALRFRQAMEKYFIAIPGKFSRGMDELEQDPRLAPVL